LKIILHRREIKRKLREYGISLGDSTIQINRNEIRRRSNSPRILKPRIRSAQPKRRSINRESNSSKYSNLKHGHLPIIEINNNEGLTPRIGVDMRRRKKRRHSRGSSSSKSRNSSRRSHRPRRNPNYDYLYRQNNYLI
jgi:hypothetical protein